MSLSSCAWSQVSLSRRQQLGQVPAQLYALSYANCSRTTNEIFMMCDKIDTSFTFALLLVLFGSFWCERARTRSLTLTRRPKFEAHSYTRLSHFYSQSVKLALVFSCSIPMKYARNFFDTHSLFSQVIAFQFIRNTFSSWFLHKRQKLIEQKKTFFRAEKKWAIIDILWIDRGENVECVCVN